MMMTTTTMTMTDAIDHAARHIDTGASSKVRVSDPVIRIFYRGFV
jgi:hypothetical protein